MILDKIVVRRKDQLAREKQENPDVVKQVQKMAVPAKDFKTAVKGPGSVPNIIGEVKKASPSKGLICENFHPQTIAEQYEKCGVSAVSVLTEEHYFLGHNHYLTEVRKTIDLPILRKDFIIDPFQIYHARALGADAILLIGAILPEDTIRAYLEIAHSLSLSCIVEVHNEEEAYAALNAGGEIIGVNNRNLKTFDVSLENTKRLSALIGKDRVLISESGIKNYSDMAQVKAWGADAVLVGETLMRAGNIEKALQGLRGSYES